MKRVFDCWEGRFFCVSLKSTTEQFRRLAHLSPAFPQIPQLFLIPTLTHDSLMAPYFYHHLQGDIDNLVAEISKHDNNIEYTLDPSIRNAKSNTLHSPASNQETPLAVFYPTSTQETSIVLRACNERRIAVTAFSGGTSLGGALTSTRGGGVCISFERMQRIVALHEDDLDIVVQPGLGWVELNEQIRDKGLFFPVDPAPGAKIGGMVW